MDFLAGGQRIILFFGSLRGKKAVGGTLWGGQVLKGGIFGRGLLLKKRGCFSKTQNL